MSAALHPGGAAGLLPMGQKSMALCWSRVVLISMSIGRFPAQALSRHHGFPSAFGSG